MASKPGIDGEPVSDIGKSDKDDEVLPEHSASQLGAAPVAQPREAIENAVVAKKAESSQLGKIAPAVRQTGLTADALSQLQKQQALQAGEKTAAEILRYAELPALEASRVLATTLDRNVVEGAGRSDMDAYQLGFEASLHPAPVMEPLFGDVPISYNPENLAQALSSTLPRVAKFLDVFPGTLEIPINDYLMDKGAGSNYRARLPAGTTVLPVRVSWREVNQSRTNDGVTDELWSALLLVTEDQPAWLINCNRVHAGDVTIADGLDAVLQSAASLVLPTDIRGLALATGLSSALYSAPNDSAAALTALAGAAITIEVTSIIVQMITLLRSAVLRKFIQIRNPGLVLEWATPPVPPATALPVPGANSVHIYGGEQSTMGTSSLRSGIRFCSGADAANCLMLAYETPEDAFSAEAIQWQLEVMGGSPGNGTIVHDVPVGSPRLSLWNEKYTFSAFTGLVILVRRGLTQAQIDAAQYGIGVVATRSAAAPGAALPPGVPAALPQLRTDETVARSQLINYCAILGVEKQLVAAEVQTDSMTCGKPTMPHGTSGMNIGLVTRDHDWARNTHREERVLAQHQVDAVNAVRLGKAPPPPPPIQPGVRGMRYDPPPMLLGPLPLKAVGAPPQPPAVVAAKAGTLAPLATRASPPPAKGVWAPNPPPVKGGGGTIVTPVPPTDFPKFKAPSVGAKPPPIPAGQLLGRLGADVLQRTTPIGLGMVQQAGVAATVASRTIEAITTSRQIVDSQLARYRDRPVDELLKDMIAASAILSGSMLAAERATGLSAAFIAPTDRMGVRGLGLPYTSELGDTVIDRSTAELRYRREICVDRSNTDGTETLTPLGVEFLRQTALRYGVRVPLSLAGTVRYRADGASGFTLPNTPYAFVGRHDVLLPGFNVANPTASIPNAAFGTFGIDSYQLGRVEKVIDGDADSKVPQTAICYSRQHEEGSILPLQTRPLVDAYGLLEPIVGVADSAAIMQAMAIGGNQQAYPAYTAAQDPARAGLPVRVRFTEVLNSNAVVSHIQVPAQIPWFDIEERAPVTGVLVGVPATVLNFLSRAAQVSGGIYESPVSRPASVLVPDRASLRPGSRIVKRVIGSTSPVSKVSRRR